MPTLLAGDGQRLGDLYARLGMAHFLLDERDEARVCFITALHTYHDGQVHMQTANELRSTTVRLSEKSKIASPGEALSAICRVLLRNHTDQYWKLHGEWQDWLQDATLDQSLHSELSAALTALDAFLDELFKLTHKSLGDDLYKPTMSIVIVLGRGLLPADTSSNWPLFASYLPAMREQFKADIGFNALYVQIRDDYSMKENEYRFLIDEIPVKQDSVPLNMRFSPTAREALTLSGIPAEALIDAPDPLTMLKGCWVAPEHYQLVLEHDCELWAEPLEYIVRALESTLRANLARFLGVQEVEDLLTAWRKETPPPAQVDQALTEGDTKFYFARALRALVREQVPIQRWQDILARIVEPEVAQADAVQILRSLRLLLQDSLPGNRPYLARIALGDSLEQRLAESIGVAQSQQDLSLFFTVVNDIIEYIQHSIDSLGWRFALVTLNPELRLFIRFIIDVSKNYPLMPVLSQEEALP